MAMPWSGHGQPWPGHGPAMGLAVLSQKVSHLTRAAVDPRASDAQAILEAAVSTTGAAVSPRTSVMFRPGVLEAVGLAGWQEYAGKKVSHFTS